MILSEIRTAVYQEAGFTTAPATDVATRVLRFINEGIRTILSEPGLARLEDSDAPFEVASVASQARYVVPEAVAQIVGISERTNDYALEVLSLDRYRRMEPDPASNTGTPTHYVPIGRVAVAVQPSNASEIFVKSTAAGDTTQTVQIEGVITGGYMRTASVTLTGATAVTLSSALTSFIEITDFYLSATAVGTVTLHEDSGLGTELARITIGALRPRYYGFALWPTPAAAVTYLVDYRRELRDLSNATDEPPLPTDYHRMVVDYVVARELTLKSDLDRAAKAEARYDLALKRLKYATQHLAGDLPVMGRGARTGHSRLGPYFPADSWR
jgi:hypothetical protein